jgi:hypothetical protein
MIHLPVRVGSPPADPVKLDILDIDIISGAFVSIGLVQGGRNEGKLRVFSGK